jgi:hypothetical protein
MPPPSREHFLELERLLDALFADLGEAIDADDLAISRDYVEHGEYGLALETLTESLAATAISISPASFQIIMRLADLMEIRGRINFDALVKRAAK